MVGKVETAAENSRMRLLKLELDPFGTNAYILHCRETGAGILVDAPGEAEFITAQLEGTNLCAILMTHSHADHTLALEDLKDKLSVPLAAHQADSAALPSAPDRMLQNRDCIPCGSLTVEVLHTPGHTPGSLCFLVDGCLLAGDTIFPGGPGKTGSPADFKQIVRSIKEKIFALPGETLLFPGHGEPTKVELEQALYKQFASRPPDPGLCGDVTWL